MKSDWKRKLTSRKFWVAVAGLAAGIILAFRGGNEAAQTVSGVIMSAASVVAYALGEGFCDAAHRDGGNEKNEKDEKDETDKKKEGAEE